MKPLLLEIGSEEIPARFLSIGLTILKDTLLPLLDKSSISYGAITEYATPRRLTLYIEDVAEQQQDRTIESLGPPKSVAYDADGNPTKAAAGFARGLNIGVKDLTIKQTERGEYVSATIHEKGRPTIDVLSDNLPKVLSSLQLPKSMRWGDSSLRYFRPIQWVLSLLGKDIIPFKLESIKSSNISYGHRFLSPVALKVDEPSLYLSLLKQNHVYADMAERKKMITDGIRKIEASEKCRIHKDEDLLETVTNLVEHPTAVLGKFEDKYLDLPDELIITVLKSHQKYFSMQDDEGRMKSSFIVISNMNKNINDTVRIGAERVLRARLEDARFYYNEDQKQSLYDYVEDLKKVTFQEKLGNLHEKAERIARIASFITDQVNPDLREKALRASILCKADIVTGVVGEFPELQGYMGMTYADNSGEDKDIAAAIYEHYMPRFAGDSVPSGELGTIVSIADKMDNITSFFYLDMIPSGSEDPFALRRQAAGIIHILQSNDYKIDLNELIDTSLKSLEPSADKRAQLTFRIKQFITQRLEGILLSDGHSHDVIKAVLASREGNLKEIKHKISIVSDLKKETGFPALLIAAKRSYNILAKVQTGEVNESLLQEDTEKKLYASAQKSEIELSSSNFKSLFQLEEPINAFFEGVLVMDKDSQKKDNRLALLAKVKTVFDSLADFSKLLD